MSTEIPLVVDLDGTLILSDSLYEGFVQLWRQQPINVALVPMWVLRGKVALKREIANRVTLDASLLPYNEDVIAHLREQRAHRKIVLCSAADQRFADAVAQHLDLFDDVIATNGQVNLSSTNKAKELVLRYGAQGFDYIGNDTADLAVFEQARFAIAVHPTAGLRRKLSTVRNLELWSDDTPNTTFAAHVRALRPTQWVKNLLVFVPLLAVFKMSEVKQIIPATLAFFAFCLVASSVYLTNDLIDLNSDRRHVRKRFRPFAAGTVPIKHGLIMTPALILSGFAISALVSPLFVGVMLLYLSVTVLYTFWLKRVALLDTLVLAGLYTLRILAGAAAITVIPSVWLLSFSMFLFLSLALAKRHSELIEMDANTSGAIPGREYRTGDLNILISQGSASGYSAVLVLALYINSDTVRSQYRHPEVIWLICPLVLYWINKLWLNSQRREIYDEPIVWAIRNRVSRAIAIVSVFLLLLARWLP
ncbi:MAG: UbiA family prenyltransferase [Gemmatimonadaceae bacterium]